MRVCQPGPVAFQRSMTSAGNRSVNNLRGFAVIGRPRFLMTMRLSISSKERREARFFAVIGFSHTNDVAIRACKRPGLGDPRNKPKQIMRVSP